MKLKITAIQDDEAITGSLIYKYNEEPTTTGTEIIYDLFNISVGSLSVKDNPKTVEPERETPGMAEIACNNPTIIEDTSLLIFSLILVFWNQEVKRRPNPVKTKSPVPIETSLAIL